MQAAAPVYLVGIVHSKVGGCLLGWGSARPVATETAAWREGGAPVLVSTQASD